MEKFYKDALIKVCTNFILFPLLYVYFLGGNDSPRQMGMMAVIWGFVMRFWEPEMDLVISPKLCVFISMILAHGTKQWVTAEVTLAIGCLMCVGCGYGLAQTLHRAREKEDDLF